MKSILTLLILFFAFQCAYSQTATNFTVNDCTGASHELFNELDSGNVVILCWVMPCASCITASKTTYNVAQSFNTSHPGRVKMYVCDDYANTNCSSLNSWCNQNGLTNTTRFSNASIKMSDYGSAGMPKVVVVGNYTHHVYYNANNSVNITLLTNAISTALEDYFVSVDDPAMANEIKVYPNPADNNVSLSFTSAKSGVCTFSLYNNSGSQVLPQQSYTIRQGENSVAVETKELNNGVYFAIIKTDSGMMRTKIVVSH